MRYSVAVSVFIICYNTKSCNVPALDSILQQTFPNFEIILVTTTGDSNYQKKEVSSSRIRRIQHIRNPRLNNETVMDFIRRFAKGKYTCIINSYERSTLNRLEVQFNYLEVHKKIGCVGGLLGSKDDHDTKSVPQKSLSYQDIKVSLLGENRITLSTAMIRTHILKKCQITIRDKFLYLGGYELMAWISTQYSIKKLQEVFTQPKVSNDSDITLLSNEKTKYENDVRKNLLNRFKIRYTKKELELHFKIMGQNYLNDSELLSSIDWLNKILYANFERRLYNQSRLYDFFEQLIVSAVNNNALGGWSIETEMLKYIKQYLPVGKSILEFGSGLGTDALLYSYKVTSIEHNLSFLRKRSKIHECLWAPIENGWYKRSVIVDALSQSYDLILVDGPPGELRTGILKNLDLFNDLSVPFLFDDVDRLVDKNIMSIFCEEIGFTFKIIKGKSKSFAFCQRK